MSFGAGALLAALTLELVHESLAKSGFAPLGIGSLTGALLFMGLNSVLNDKGAFLRKLSTTASYLTRKKRLEAESLLEKCANIGLLRALPPDEVQVLLKALRPAEFLEGATVFSEGDPAAHLYIIESGSGQVLRDGKAFAQVGPGDAFGEIALLHHAPRAATVRTLAPMKAWSLDKAEFEKILQDSPALLESFLKIDAARQEQIDRAAERDGGGRMAWAKTAKDHISAQHVAPSPRDIAEAQEEHGGAAMAIWLGILLDGIPESLVIGASMIGSGAVSLTLIAGVFLANFPEALSSAVGMRRQGIGVTKILWMWGSLMVMTGIGAFIGNLTFGSMNPSAFALIEGMAAGAMLAMIAETMLPEAAEQGGPASGLMTVLGFLAAIGVNSLGASH